MREGLKLTQEMKARVKDAIRVGLSVRHVPAYVFEVGDIPVCFFCYDLLFIK